MRSTHVPIPQNKKRICQVNNSVEWLLLYCHRQNMLSITDPIFSKNLLCGGCAQRCDSNPGFRSPLFPRLLHLARGHVLSLSCVIPTPTLPALRWVLLHLAKRHRPTESIRFSGRFGCLRFSDIIGEDNTRVRIFMYLHDYL